MVSAILHRLLVFPVAIAPSPNLCGPAGGPKMSVAFVREESAEAAQEVSLPPRAISPHPNLVTQSGLRALEQALAESRQALKTALVIEDAKRAPSRSRT